MPTTPPQVLRARVAADRRHRLAEGPVWDATARLLRWVDIEAGEVLRGTLAHGDVTVTGATRVDRTVGAAVPGPDGTLLVAAATALVTLGPDGSRTEGPHLVGTPTRRLNDGACDPAGRFVVGTLGLSGPSGTETLVRLEHDGSVTTLDDDLGQSNGLGWSPDGRTLYSTDTAVSRIWRRPYDPATGAVGAREVHLEVDGLPDGLAVDETGDLWVAVWGAGQVRRYGPDGRVRAVVEVPAPHTTSVAFAGEDLDVLVITTATAGLTPDDAASFPDSGRLFTAVPGVRGRPTTPWAGPGTAVDSHPSAG